MMTDTPGSTREAAIARLGASKHDVEALRNHVQVIVASPVFKSSRRSQQFLSYIIESAIQGRFDSLKERVIGVELFQRSPSYDTGEDAIVRVTASDVRKRLLQYYGRYGADSEFRIELPPGSYIPEVVRTNPETEHATQKADASVASVEHAGDSPAKAAAAAAGLEENAAALSVRPAAKSEAASSSRRKQRAGYIAAAIVVLLLVFWGAFVMQHRGDRGGSASKVLPWSYFIDSGYKLELITSDPDITKLQELAGRDVSVSDYANIVNGTGGPASNTLPGDNASYVDAPIAVDIAGILPPDAKLMTVRSARSLRPADFHTDNNYVLLGSPRSNPWYSLFSDQLDFVFDFDKQLRRETIRNLRPRPGEPEIFVPAARGLQTGESFALISLVQNPNQNGQALLIAGVSAEGTEAAGRFVTNLPLLSETLRKCGIAPDGPVRHFQILLRLNTLAGSATQFSDMACHPLPGRNGN